MLAATGNESGANSGAAQRGEFRRSSSPCATIVHLARNTSTGGTTATATIATTATATATIDLVGGHKTGATSASPTGTSTVAVRVPNVYDICHPLVMESPAGRPESIGTRLHTTLRRPVT
uniref:Uncharacterized protein n=1 Tax=Anopheles albimanus TaxID=7167 RepID=A0A182FJB4_ANOAL